MNSAEIKIELFRKLDGLKDQSLKEAYGLLLNHINGNKDLNDWDNLSQEQQKAIKLGLKQLDKGQGRAHNDVLSDFRKQFSND